MAPRTAQQERLITLLAQQTRHIMNGMSRVGKTVAPSDIKRRPQGPQGSASLSRLDSLPLELLHLIFAMLDFQTLSRITKTCLRGNEVISSLPEYRDVIQYAPRSLVALGQTRLIRYHSAANVHVTLLSARCMSCGEYGAFCFLPTFERCCFNCLWRTQSLCIVPIAQAVKCFDLPTLMVRQLPIMRSLPGKYCVRYNISRERPVRIVSIRAVKELAVKEHKCGDHLAPELEAKRDIGGSMKYYYKFRWLQAAPLQPPGPGLAHRPSEANKPEYQYCGMASIPFPSLSTGHRVEYGIWCRGCEETCRSWSPNKPFREEVFRFYPPGADIKTGLYKMQQVARSESAFFTHIAHCPGAQQLLQDPETDPEQLEQLGY